MSRPQDPTQRLEKLFRRRKCWLLDQLAQTLGYALISVRRFLKQIGYHRSYTHNGKWYTLHDSPVFDRDGLWRFRGIGFSKQGSLTATIDHRLARSPAGLSATQLAQRLQHPCDAVLTRLHQAGRLDRARLGGQFVYLSADPQINRRQREQAALALPPIAATSLSTQTALWVLVEYIKDPTLSFEQLARRLQEQRRLAVAPQDIERFFQEHALKKTPGASTGKHS